VFECPEQKTLEILKPPAHQTQHVIGIVQKLLAVRSIGHG